MTYCDPGTALAALAAAFDTQRTPAIRQKHTSSITTKGRAGNESNDVR